MTILVDTGELRSPVPRALQAAGVRVRTASLGVADDLVAEGVGVERKTGRDFGRSIVSGRLWQQVARMRTLARPYLIIEGMYPTTGVARAGVHGAVLQIVENDVTVLWSRDAEDTAGWLIQLAKRGLKRGRSDLPPRRRRTAGVTTSVGLLSSIPGITPATAEHLLEVFGSVAGIATASHEQLMQVRGLGPKRASSVAKALGSPLLLI